jgi:hypothetical protein
VAYSRKAEALLESFKQFDLPFDPELVVHGLREERLEPITEAERHMLADVIEAQNDMIVYLRSVQRNT